MIPIDEKRERKNADDASAVRGTLLPAKLWADLASLCQYLDQSFQASVTPGQTNSAEVVTLVTKNS